MSKTTSVAQFDIARELLAVFGTAEFKDGERDIALHVLPPDVAKAVPGDCEHCLFAETARREYNASAVMFWRTTAYLQIEGTVYRFILPKPVQRIIRRLDTRGTVDPLHEDTVVHLHAPTGYRKLEKRRKYDQDAKRKRDEGIEPDAAAVARGKKSARTRLAHTLEGVRQA